MGVEEWAVQPSLLPPLDPLQVLLLVLLLLVLLLLLLVHCLAREVVGPFIREGHCPSSGTWRYCGHKGYRCRVARKELPLLGVLEVGG